MKNQIKQQILIHAVLLVVILLTVFFTQMSEAQEVRPPVGLSIGGITTNMTAATIAQLDNQQAMREVVAYLLRRPHLSLQKHDIRESLRQPSLLGA